MAALAVLAAAAAVVSWDAQYVMVSQVKHTPAVAALEAGVPDVGAVIFAALGIALALHRGTARRILRAHVQALQQAISGPPSRWNDSCSHDPEQRKARASVVRRSTRAHFQPSREGGTNKVYARRNLGLFPRNGEDLRSMIAMLAITPPGRKAR